MAHRRCGPAVLQSDLQYQKLYQQHVDLSEQDGHRHCAQRARHGQHGLRRQQGARKGHEGHQRAGCVQPVLYGRPDPSVYPLSEPGASAQLLGHGHSRSAEYHLFHHHAQLLFLFCAKVFGGSGTAGRLYGYRRVLPHRHPCEPQHAGGHCAVHRSHQLERLLQLHDVYFQ